MPTSCSKGNASERYTKSMATMKEIGLGLTTLLRASKTPEPLAVDLWNERPAEAAALVRSILAECHDAGISLKVVRVPQSVWAFLAQDASSIVRPLDAQVVVDPALKDRLEFWRK